LGLMVVLLVQTGSSTLVLLALLTFPVVSFSCEWTLRLNNEPANSSEGNPHKPQKSHGQGTAPAYSWGKETPKCSVLRPEATPQTSIGTGLFARQFQELQGIKAWRPIIGINNAAKE
jgi:hypothetical protein